ncbi:hypothetical protein JBO49_04510 [Serratia fonticola]|uniref:DUF6680 family protein n=1 Tax=Serratia fonticola TaxID=47917 RepID=UPI00192BB17E|nr:DUF6680 family protein [Serratia fonticola]MBL5859877.1 hypothetical protein [Serratia fonticola]
MFSWQASISAGDCLVALCTALSPLIAIQVSKFIEQKKSIRNEQITIFKTLMRTRAEPLDRRHVESLNSIDVVFSGGSKSEATIRSDWKAYLDILGRGPMGDFNPEINTKIDIWRTQKDDKFIALMSSMSIYLGYNIDNTDIRNQAYLPKGYTDFSRTQADAQQALLNILTGATPLQVKVVSQESINEPSET